MLATGSSEPRSMPKMCDKRAHAFLSVQTRDRRLLKIELSAIPIAKDTLERPSSESGPGVPGPTFMSYFSERSRFRLNSASTIAKLDPLQLFNAQHR